MLEGKEVEITDTREGPWMYMIEVAAEEKSLFGGTAMMYVVIDVDGDTGHVPRKAQLAGQIVEYLWGGKGGGKGDCGPCREFRWSRMGWDGVGWL